MNFLSALRVAEFEIGGFLVPWAMVVWSLAYVLALAISTGLEAMGWMRRVWHPPLFFVALTVIFGGALGWFFAP